ncbi:class I SAM-dependent methyltransferase [bacterium]|nr:class I SAM-dependent methyltransferase [bacterium]
MSKEDRLKWIYSSKDNEELAERYDEWAESYDQELEEDYGWQIPQLIAEELSHLTPRSSRVLDAGAGTGLVGRYLGALGYSDLVAIDLSNEMLNKAREKSVYGEFHQMDLAETLNFPDDSFDAVVCSGVLTFSHAPAKSLNELVRVTKPGGHLLYSLRTDAYESMGFEDITRGLDADGKWELLEKKGHQSFAEKEQEVVHDIWVYQVL